MVRNTMNIYALGGLGADKRVFKYLNLNHKIKIIDWIKHAKNESIKEYALRLIENISINEPFILLGVSFGGLVAVEISKVIKPQLLILVSSVEFNSQLRRSYRIIGKTKILKIIPKRLFLPPKFLANYLFGAKNKKLLDQIIKDTDLSFAKWAVNQLVCWQNEDVMEQCVKISGTKDILMPAKNIKKAILVEGGGHFMIVDKAKEISELLNIEVGRMKE